MNYQRIYDEIIERAKSRGLNKKLLEGYFEKHHIIPKCLGGSNDKDNLVLLTAREHYICHYLLWKSNKDSVSLTMAYHKMIHQSNEFQARKFNITSKQYESLRLSHSLQVSKRMKGRIKGVDERLKIGAAFKGKALSNEHRQAIKNSMTDVVKRKISDAAKKRPLRTGVNATFKRKCTIDGKEFITLLDGAKYAKEHYGISYSTMLRRLKSEKFSTWKY